MARSSHVPETFCQERNGRMSNYPNYNPYQSPPGGGYGPSGYGQPPTGDASGKVTPVAICMISVASLSVLVFAASLLINIVMGSAFAARNQFGGPNQLDPETQWIANIIGGIVILVVNGITLIGSIQMLRLRSYGLAMTAAVLAVIPCCSPCYILGIPFGIWAIVVLAQPNVKLAFRD